jgi:hypothetical protein
MIDDDDDWWWWLMMIDDDDDDDDDNISLFHSIKNTNQMLQILCTGIWNYISVKALFYLVCKKLYYTYRI